MEAIKDHSKLMWITVVTCLCAMMGALHTPSAMAALYLLGMFYFVGQ
jgi:hypothetical protein